MFCDKSLYKLKFHIHVIDLSHTGPKSLLIPMILRSRSQTLKFHFSVFWRSDIQTSTMDLIHIWYDDRFGARVLFSYTPVYTNGVKEKAHRYFSCQAVLSDVSSC